MGIPAAGFEINDFTLERYGARVFAHVDIDGLTMPATATMEVAIRFRNALDDAIADFQRENGRNAIGAELSIVPLCELCVRYDLPKHEG
jgi:hypothetical protein